MKKLFIITCIAFCFSCEQKTEPLKIQEFDAQVSKIQGLHVFILSEPKHDYEILGDVTNNFGEQLGEATEGKKKFKDIMEGVFSTAANNADFQKLLKHMSTQAREQYKDADGILFKFNLSQGTAIKFKEE